MHAVSNSANVRAPSSSLANPPVDSTVELIFLGTGTSTSLPHVECLTAPPSQHPCRTCLSTLHPAGKKNIRRNTSAVFRVKDKHGKKITIVCDVGKNFQAAALEWFPKYGLRQIDAVLITHAHADAMNGLDDLRAWTLRSAIQPHIDLYVSENTFTEVCRTFPYLVSKEFASGGGDVPEFKWHIIEEKCPFEIENTGVWVTPFAVHHGRYFSKPPPPHQGFLPTPEYTSPPTPTSAQAADGTHMFAGSSPNSVAKALEAPPRIQPYICFGFQIADSVVYISDTSYIPEDTWAVLAAPKGANPCHQYPVFVIDCLRFDAHTSHFGLKEAVDTVRRLKAKRSYLTGFSHEISHDEYVAILESVGRPSAHGQMRSIRSNLDVDEEKVEKGIDIVGQGEAQWVRPAFDGLVVEVDRNGAVVDSEY